MNDDDLKFLFRGLSIFAAVFAFPPMVAWMLNEGAMNGSQIASLVFVGMTFATIGTWISGACWTSGAQFASGLLKVWHAKQDLKIRRLQVEAAQMEKLLNEASK